jgi:hypothetical protein
MIPERQRRITHAGKFDVHHGWRYFCSRRNRADYLGSEEDMHAILVHGMGRTPLSLLVLAKRLRRQGFATHLFAYSTLQPFGTSVARLDSHVRTLGAEEPFVFIGHSLGCVLIRAVLPQLEPIQPVACFLLAPPSKVTKAARFFAKNSLYRFLTRECGQLLVDEGFMQSLGMPTVPVRVYSGTAGWKGRFSPFKQEDNDGILAVSETQLNSDDVVRIPAIHTFIMNSDLVSRDIAAKTASLRNAGAAL